VRIILAAVVSFVVAACAVPGSTIRDGPGLAGTYVVNGVDPLGVEYSGTVIIGRASDPGAYRVEWIVTGGIHEGVGTQAGERFIVDWATVSGPREGATGTAEYRVEADGRLVGTRTVDGLDGVGTEEIFPDT
jgi:hypothetical protein